MLHFLPPPLLGVLTFLLLVLNIAFWVALLLPAALIRLLVPVAAWQRTWGRALVWIADTWVGINGGLLRLTQRIEWEVKLPEGLSPDGWYLVVSNHQSWVDIIALFQPLHRRIPFPRFFLKRELLWLPFVGLGSWALDFPFVRRYPKELLEKRPELRGKDLETTRKAVERLRQAPVTILNFLEGTRFTPEKHAEQQSPYRHLLIPRAGGIAHVLQAMGPQLRAMLDATIVYPDGRPGFWDLLSGRLRRVIVHVRRIEVPRDLLVGDWEEDPVFRERFQIWVREMWREKDELIERLLKGAPEGRWAKVLGAVEP
ncbi:MAG: acyltransferase [Thermoanaerobaculia bacterium]